MDNTEYRVIIDGQLFGTFANMENAHDAFNVQSCNTCYRDTNRDCCDVEERMS